MNLTVIFCSIPVHGNVLFISKHRDVNSVVDGEQWGHMYLEWSSKSNLKVGVIGTRQRAFDELEINLNKL